MALVQSAQNFGRLVNLITGIQGVAPGGQASINMQTNQRVHRLNFQCTGIAWKAPLVVFGGPGTGATGTATVVNGVITGVTVTAGGTGYTSATVNFIDEIYGVNLFNATGTVTVSGGAVTAVTITSGGSISPVPVGRFFTTFKQVVNGTIMRDIQASEILAIAAYNNELPYINGSVGSFKTPQVLVDLLSTGTTTTVNPYKVGQLPVYMTEPWRKIVNHDTATSWDLFGQSTYQILAGITSNITSPGLTGAYEFDYLRNAIRDSSGKGTPQYFLKPVKQHSYTFNVPAGVYDITNIAINFPIQRMFFYGAAAPYQLEVYSDGNKVLEGTAEQINQMYRDYGFNTDVFTMAAIFDVDQRLGNALKTQRALDVRIWNANAAPLTVVVESTPPAYT